MQNLYLQIIGCIVGVAGFCFVFRLRYSHIIAATIGSVFCWLIFYYCRKWGLSIIPSSLFSAMFCEFYAEILAKKQKAPATLFLMPSIFPLIPGKSLFYTFYYLADKTYLLAKLCCIETIQYVFAIAAGISLAWYFYFFITEIIKKIKA